MATEVYNDLNKIYDRNGNGTSAPFALQKMLRAAHQLCTQAAQDALGPTQFDVLLGEMVWERRYQQAMPEETRRKFLEGELYGLGLGQAEFGGSDLFYRLRGQSDGLALPIAIPSDRKHGQFWPFWRTEQERNRLVQYSRVLANSNAYGAGILLNRTNYTIGKGFAYKAQPKKKNGRDYSETDPALERLVDAVQDVIDDFLAYNCWNSASSPVASSVVVMPREREAYQRVVTDGEAIVRLYRDKENARLITRFHEPECLRQPPNGTYENGWAFGKLHQMQPYEDVETVEKYHFYWHDPGAALQNEAPHQDRTSVGELVDADEIVHLLGPQTASTVIRGTPFFTFDVGRALERASKLQRNISLSSAIRAAVAEIQQFANALPNQGAAYVGGMTNDVGIGATSGQPTSVQHIEPGAIRYMGPGIQFVSPPGDTGTESHLSAKRGDLMQAVASIGAPEFWTGDVSSGNYSNLETSAAPAVKQGEAEQEYYKAAFVRVVWKAVQYAVECGRLSKDALRRVEIQVEAPAVLHRNELEQAQKDQIYNTIRVKSAQTIQMEQGLDPQTEAANFAESAQQGPQPDVLPMPGDDDPTQVGKPQELPHAEPPKLKLAQESVDAARYAEQLEASYWLEQQGAK